MKKSDFIKILITVFIFLANLASVETRDFFLGDYEGIFISPAHGYLKNNPECVAQVYPVSNAEYIIQFLPKFDVRGEDYKTISGYLVSNKIVFSDSTVYGEITDGKLTGLLKFRGVWEKFELTKTERLSTSLGIDPPKNAILLFDGTNFDHWIGDGELPVKWEIVNDNEMLVVPSTTRVRPRTSLYTKKTFSNLFLHLEFQLPLMADSKGQARTNSGVVFGNNFEIQILDSYGLDGTWIECGALYQIRPPDVNMCAPPFTWQTYDIIFYSPKFDEAGNIVKDACVTVYHNGKCIHYQYPLNKPADIPFIPFKIMLQDHWDVLKFRNIWALDLTENPGIPEYINNLER